MKTVLYKKLNFSFFVKEFLAKNWKLIVFLLLVVWIIFSVLYFVVKFNVLKRRKKLKLKEDVIIIYNDKLEEPPI